MENYPGIYILHYPKFYPQVGATDEKTKLEEAQRAAVRYWKSNKLCPFFKCIEYKMLMLFMGYRESY